MQETYCSSDFEGKFKKGWHGKIYHSFSNSHHSRGVCILFKNRLDYDIISSHTCNEGRILLINIVMHNKEYCLVNIYAPNNLVERGKFFDKCKLFIHRHARENSNLLIGGDFNTVLNKEDRMSLKADTCIKTLNSFMTSMSLTDIWKATNPRKIKYTYIDPNNQSSSRIDFWLISNTLEPKCNTCDIVSNPAPDHKAVVLEISLIDKKRGKGYWKMNANVLKENDYKENMQKILETIISDYQAHVAKSQLWEYIKRKVKEFTIGYCRRRATEKKSREKELEYLVDSLDEKYQETQKGDLLKTKQTLKAELDSIYTEKAKGYQIRSRSKWIEEGEKSSKYFLGLEKKHGALNCIESLRDEAGSLKTNDSDILNITHSFYKDLYSSHAASTDKINSWFESIQPDKKLTETEKSLCEGKITLEECKGAILKIKGNKSPGLDGLCIEFYKEFWDTIGHIMVEAFNESYDNETLSISQQTSVFSLIFKKGDRTDIKNYRPISLTNLDYRILAFILANRLQKVMGNIISSCQTAYIRGRYMGYNIRLVNDIIDNYEKLENNGILFMADFKKAFDTLEWGFILKALQFFNFGESFIKWITTIYHSPKACVKNNGFMSETFELHRGIRQGCPASALLFIIAAEMLAIKFKQSDVIEGLRLGAGNDKRVKISQYADDCMLFINNLDELRHAINILNEYGEVAGLVLNLGKCEGMTIGRNRHLIDTTDYLDIKWQENMKYLGIYIGNDKNFNETKNWYEKLEMISDCLNTWRQRDLSLYGKVLIIKTFAISKIVLAATLLTTPKGFVKSLNKVLFTFIWGKSEKVSRIKTMQKVTEGGLNMVHIEKLIASFKANWIYRYIKCQNDDPWTIIPSQYFKRFESIDIIKHSNIDNKSKWDELELLPPFWHEVISSYAQLNNTEHEPIEVNIYSQQIWGNKFFTVKRKRKQKDILFFRNWIKSGIIYVRDLKFNNGKLDINHMYEIIEEKRNVISQLYEVRQALLPYKNILARKQNEDNTANIYERQICKSKEIYNQLLRPLLMDKNDNFYCLPMQIKEIVETKDDAICKKFCNIKEIKLKEFYFKVLHGILPCQANLARWRIREDNLCDVCGEVQDIKHLLFDCLYVKPLWQVIEDIVKTKITYTDILFCIDDTADSSFKNCIIDFCAYAIYKEWLIHSLESKIRSKTCNLYFFENEICLRYKIYQKIHLI